MKISLNTIQKVFACIFMLIIGAIALNEKLSLIQFIGLLMIALALIYLIGLVKPKIVLIIIGSLILIYGLMILFAVIMGKGPFTQRPMNDFEKWREQQSTKKTMTEADLDRLLQQPITNTTMTRADLHRLLFETEFKAKWRKLQKGMTKDQVRAILGEPTKISELSYGTHWYYDGNSEVMFDRRTETLETWNEPQ